MTTPGPIWIADDNEALQRRFVVIAHCGPAGHRGSAATLKALSQLFFWTTLFADFKLFVSSCMHCLSTTGGASVPRLFGSTLHGTEPNDLVQLDYIDMCPTPTADHYILIIGDDHSGYAWFYPTNSTSADAAANALIN